MTTSEVGIVNKFIKVLEPKLQQEFADLGFSYTIEKLGDKQIFAFADSKELRKYIASKYANTKGICYFDDKLFF
jgi:hypothetical protein